jgi:16S rRNA (adenine1518-N6/adenine1519-N6)-dimethyltransferase
MSRPTSQGIAIKKQFGQHFLRDQAIIDRIVSSVVLTPSTSVFEIGCGDGVLTRAILQEKIKRLWVFEIDPDWVAHARKTFADNRLTVFQEDILDVNFDRFKDNAPWTLLANLPYQITFPLLHMLQRNRALLKEGVIMVQEEVAQKIMKSSGRDYGFVSLFFQHFFEWKLLDKIAPTAFYPPPKVFSRLMYFKPRSNVPPILDEENFWKFIKICFKQPRRTLRNNLAQTHYPIDKISEKTLALRSQQLNFDDFLKLWVSLQ